MPNPQQDGRRRVVIETISPEIDGAASPAKRTIGRHSRRGSRYFCRRARCHCGPSLLYRPRRSNRLARKAPMNLLVNDRWSGEFNTVSPTGPLPLRPSAAGSIIGRLGVATSSSSAFKPNNENRYRLSNRSKSNWTRAGRPGQKARDAGLATRPSAVPARLARSRNRGRRDAYHLCV